MSFFVSDAYAQAAGAAPSPILQILPLIFIFALMYFMVIRPQMKKAKEHRAMVEALAKGDEIITNGGIAGRIVDLGDTFATVEIAPNTQIKVQRGAIGTVLPKGTLKSL
jgi:preprotein translocase subunit YajC